MEDIQFHLTGNDHLRLEQAEEYLQKAHKSEVMLDVDMATLDLSMPAGYGPLSDCRLRVYLDPSWQRGHFHLVGHRASDGSLIYTNAVLIAQML